MAVQQIPEKQIVYPPNGGVYSKMNRWNSSSYVWQLKTDLPDQLFTYLTAKN